MSVFLSDGSAPSVRRSARLLGVVAALLLVAIAARPARSDAPPADLPGLLARFRQVRGLEAEFHEEKSVALLRDPIVSDGRIYFQPPDRLARHVVAPVRSSMVLEGNELRFGDGTSSERLDLRAHPEARVFVDAFRAVLAGDSAAIERSFSTRFTKGSDGNWSLDLTPLDATVRRALRSVRMTGTDVRLTTLDVVEASGDVSRTHFTRVDAARSFSRAELRRIFRVGGS